MVVFKTAKYREPAKVDPHNLVECTKFTKTVTKVNIFFTKVTNMYINCKILYYNFNDYHLPVNHINKMYNLIYT